MSKILYTKFLYYLFKYAHKKRGDDSFCIKNISKSKINRIKELKNKLKNYKLKICFIGRVSVSKGIDHILNLCKLFKNNKKVVFFIGGTTDFLIKEKYFLLKKTKFKNLILHLNGINNEDVGTFTLVLI